MSKVLSRYLTPLDASFLYAERPTQTMHIGSCMIYEGRIEREELAQLLLERLHLVPRYRQRVVFPPLALSHPFWLDDPDFDIDNHIEVVELGGEVDDRRLSQIIAEAYHGMLDRNHPLWSATIIHGLPEGDTAIVWKVHHCMIDGVSGVDLTMALNSLTPDAEPPPPLAEPWKPEPLPEALNLLQEAVQHRLAEVTRAWTEATFDLFRFEKMRQRASTMSSGLRVGLARSLTPAARTSFNNRVSGKLAYAWAPFSFTEVRQMKNELGGTVNDLVLTILSGGIGKYLRSRGERTEGVELRAMCPVSMRQADEHGQLGNLVSVMMAPLFVGIEDPAERHRAECGAMSDLKQAGQAEALYEFSRLGDFVPPTLQGALTLLPIPNQRAFNTVSTNIPGPQIPLYQAGRKLKRWLPLGILSSNIGLFVSILTYNGQIVLGVTADPEQIPDPWEIAGFLGEAYDELRRLAAIEVTEITLRGVGKRSERAVAGEPSRSARARARESTTKRTSHPDSEKAMAKRSAETAEPRSPRTSSDVGRDVAAG